MPLTPYWYQQEAIDAAMDFLFNDKGNGLLWLPTAAGKSLVQAEIVKRILEVAPDFQVLCLTDVTSLVGQNRLEMIGQAPNIKATIYSAKYGEKKHNGEAVFGSIQSIYNKADLFDKVSVIFIDEQHRASLEEGSMYHQFYMAIKKKNPHVRILGLTGSPWKIDGPLEGTWLCDKIIYQISYKVLFEQGFLNPIITPPMTNHADTSKIKISSSGEFNEEAMMELFDDDYLTKKALDEAMRYTHDRHSVLLFASGVNHGYQIKKDLESRGFEAEVITGDTPKEERDRIVGLFNDLKLKYLISIGTLTTGFNSRVADAAIVLRATQSSALWLQIIGRVLRTHESKTNAIVLDFGENVERFGPIERIRPPKTKEEVKKSKRSPFKQCPNCKKYDVPALENFCPKCDHEFVTEIRSPNHGTELSSNDIVGDIGRNIRTMPVSEVTFRNHTSRRKGNQGATPKLRVRYHIGNGLEYYDEYFDFAATGWQRNMACNWWYAFADERISQTCPVSVAAAVAELNEYGSKVPKTITVDMTDAKSNHGTIYGYKVMSKEL